MAHDIIRLRQAGTRRLVCLLADEELARLRVPALVADVAAAAITVSQHPVVDGGVSTDRAGWAALVGEVLGDVRRGGTVVVHCRAGFGRTGTCIACVLVAAGVDAETAMKCVRSVRGFAIETRAQESFVRRF